jgi:ATP/maltotriose-dependent transcriptional regulator MalT
MVAETVRLGRDRGHEWSTGELGYWRWVAGAEPEPGAAPPFALQMSGDPGAAAEHWRALGCPYEAAMALADGSADEQLVALQALRDLGATPAANLVTRRLREQGVRGIPRGPRRATRANPANLTGREAEVLDLLADGMRNADIAAQLHIAIKTVDHHVSAILGKLGVATRQEAVRAAQHG